MVRIIVTVLLLSSAYVAAAKADCDGTDFEVVKQTSYEKLDICIDGLTTRLESIIELNKQSGEIARSLADRKRREVKGIKVECLEFVIEQKEMVDNFGISCAGRDEWKRWSKSIAEATKLFSRD